MQTWDEESSPDRTVPTPAPAVPTASPGSTVPAGAVPAPEGELCDSHFGVAVAVAVGAVDAGLAVRAVAEAVDADFLPVEWGGFGLAGSPPAAGRNPAWVSPTMTVVGIASVANWSRIDG